MKILYSYVTVPSDGGRVHIESFVKAYRSLGETVIENGVILEPYAGDKESWSLKKKFVIKLKWFTANIGHFLRTLRMARDHRPDVLLFRFLPLHQFFLSIIVLSYFFPVVLEVNALRSIENYKNRPRSSDLLDRYSLNHARRCFVVSERLKEHIGAHYNVEAHRIKVIANGVNVNEFNPDIPGWELERILGLRNRFIVGFVGSFRPWHGIDYLISLAEKVVPQLPNVFFLMVGDGDDRSVYEKKVTEIGLTEYFHFTGRVAHEEIPRYLSSMDVVMAPVVKGSFLGGFHGSPLKIFEYMAMAKPVIAPPMGQICEVIADGISGLLIASEDTHQLAQTLLRLWQDPVWRERLGQNARMRVMKEFTWIMNAKKVKELCEEACNV